MFTELLRWVVVALVPVWNKYVLGPKYETQEWTKAFYANWWGTLAPLAAALIADATSLEKMYMSMAAEGFGWQILMGLCISFGAIATYTTLDTIGTFRVCLRSHVDSRCRNRVLGVDACPTSRPRVLFDHVVVYAGHQCHRQGSGARVNELTGNAICGYVACRGLDFLFLRGFNAIVVCVFGQAA